MSAVPPPLPDLRPIEFADRAFGIDVVRGFAVLGLIFANIPFFASTAPYFEWMGLAPDRPGAAFWSAFLVDFFLGGKCVALFAFLLGAGLAWQQRRAEATGGDFRRLAWRRMGALFGIGLLHMLLLWWGDVLCFYAVLGVTLLPASRLAPRARRILAGALLAGSVLLLGGMTVAGLIADAAAPPDEDDGFMKFIREILAIVERTYRDGGFLALVPLRALEALVGQAMTVATGPFYFGLALLGYDAVRTGWLPGGPLPARLISKSDGAERHPYPSVGTPLRGVPLLPAFPALPARARPWILGGTALTIGLAGVTAFFWAAFPSSSAAAALDGIVALPASVVMAAVYFLVLTRVAASRFAGWLVPVARVGRTALSNYLLQSLLAGLVFYGYGAGLYGQLDPATTMAVAAGIALVELAWPGCWLAWFRHGPAEALWRRLAYGSRPRSGPGSLTS